MADDIRKKVQRIIDEKGLCSCMNATKWNELRNAVINELPFQPPFIVKFLMDEECFGEQDFERDVYHTADWHYAYSIDGYSFDASFAIEWIRIHPRYLKSRGALLEPEVVSCEKEFVQVLNKYNIPYEEENGVYTVYGYR